MLAGKEIAQTTSEPVGCFIGKVQRTKPSGDITYARHIAPVLHAHCVHCHRPGQIGPFSLTSYEETLGWAETIREVVAAGRMPPWHANPDHGKFFNDIRLTDAEKQQIAKWVENGCPEGDAAELLKLPEFVDGWQIPRPDVVLKMPKPFQVPAKGVVEYQHFVIDPGFPEDRWVAAAEARPGNRAVTHHLILFFQPPGSDSWEPTAPLFNSIAGFAPGMPPALYPEGTYRRIPAGSKLILQAHYTPNGSPQTDQSEVGLVFADPKQVKREMTVGAAMTWQFAIPPGASDHKVEATYRFDQDSLLYALTPHMHLRGKSFRFDAIYPDGREEILLDVPRYDFNWQNTYGLAEPKRIPEGTQIRCTAVYDNSADNLANPNPKIPVTWGDQTWQEMMVGTWGTSLEHQDLSIGPPQVRKLDDGDYEATFRYRPAGEPEAVYLAGTFNEWKPADLRMDGPDGDGFYTKRMTLKPGAHEYKFVIDGEHWRFDPGNPNQVGYFRNSKLVVGPPAGPAVDPVAEPKE
jgi:hypothetical protein